MDKIDSAAAQLRNWPKQMLFVKHQTHLSVLRNASLDGFCECHGHLRLRVEIDSSADLCPDTGVFCGSLRCLVVVKIV